jgi:hypothetical protein
MAEAWRHVEKAPNPPRTALHPIGLRHMYYIYDTVYVGTVRNLLHRSVAARMLTLAI